MSLSTSFFSFITVIDYYQCDLIITHTICLINNYNTNSIDDELILNVGRPFGGMGIMWRKTLNNTAHLRHRGVCKRIVGLELNCDSFKV